MSMTGGLNWSFSWCDSEAIQIPIQVWNTIVIQPLKLIVILGLNIRLHDPSESHGNLHFKRFGSTASILIMFGCLSLVLNHGNGDVDHKFAEEIMKHLQTILEAVDNVGATKPGHQLTSETSGVCTVAPLGMGNSILVILLKLSDDIGSPASIYGRYVVIG